MVNVVPREVPRPWDLPRHNIHHDTSSAFSNNVPFYCHSVVKIIAPLFVYVGPQPIGSKLPQPTQLSDGVGCQIWFSAFHLENVGFVPKKQVKWPFLGAVNSSRLSSHAYYSQNYKGIDQKLRCSDMLGPLAFRWLG